MSTVDDFAAVRAGLRGHLPGERHEEAEAALARIEERVKDDADDVRFAQFILNHEIDCVTCDAPTANVQCAWCREGKSKAAKLRAEVDRLRAALKLLMPMGLHRDTSCVCRQCEGYRLGRAALRDE